MRVIVFPIVLWLLATPALANDLFLAAGRIEAVKGRGGCSAVLIRPDVILTAAHCVSENEENSYVFRLAGEREPTPVRRVMMHPLYVAFFAHKLRRLRFDLAIGQLERPFDPEEVQPMSLGPAASLGEGLFLVSWRNVRNPRPIRRRCLVIEGRFPGVITMGCRVRGGESGAPVLRLKDGGMELVAIVNSTTRQDGRSVALASDVMDRISVLFDRLEATP